MSVYNEATEVIYSYGYRFYKLILRPTMSFSLQITTKYISTAFRNLKSELSRCNNKLSTKNQYQLILTREYNYFYVYKTLAKNEYN